MMVKSKKKSKIKLAKKLAGPAKKKKSRVIASILSQKFLTRVLTFLVRFLLLAAPAYLLFKAGLDFTRLQEIIAGQTAWLANLMGVESTVSSYLIRTPGVWFEVVEACTAWRDVVGLIALVVAVPAVSLKKRSWSLIGIPVLYIVNLFRLATTIVIGNYFPPFLHLAHDVMWKFFSAVFIVIVWVAWLKWAPE